MAGLQNLLEAYKNYRGVQDWKLGQQMNRVPGAEEAMDLWGGWDTGGLAGAIKAYHGNPRGEPFTKFRKEFMGTGAGQVYGRGHYFAEDPKVAKKYAVGKTPSLYEISLEWPGARESVDPMSNEHFYQWDKTFKNQPQHIRQALEEIAQENPNIADDYIQFLERNQSKGHTLSNLLYQRPELLIKEVGLEPYMQEKGIPGIAYKNRTWGTQPSYNYVVFEDEIPKILSHNKPSVWDLVNK